MPVTIAGTSNLVLQVVQAAKTDAFSSAHTGGFVDIPGLSLSITPTSTTSKIVIFCIIGGFHSWGGGRERSTSFRVFRNGSDTLIGDPSSSRQRALFRAGSANGDGNHNYGASFSFVDSPNTTSPITYKLSCFPESGSSIFLNRTVTDTDINDAYGSRVVSTIIAMEIAG